MNVIIQIFITIKIYFMSKLTKFTSSITISILSLICLLFVLYGCQKNNELNTINVPNSYKSNIVEELKTFTKRMKDIKQGNVLVQRDENDMTPEQLSSHVEGSFNLDYGYYKIYHGQYELDTMLFNYSINNGVLTETEQATFYDDAYEFISDHFDEVDGEDKLGSIYDVSVVSSSTNAVCFEVISVVGLESDGETSWGSGDDFHAMLDQKCNTDASPRAPLLLAAAANKDLNSTPDGTAFVISTCKYEIGYDANLWHFACWFGPPNDPQRCSSTLCSSFSNQEIEDIYCIDHNEMNDYLTYIEETVIPNHICNERTFANIVLDRTALLCMYLMNGSWTGKITYGIPQYTRTEYVEAPYRTP
jgi:hypothetical protein